MLYIHGMGHFHPENKIDNAFLENLNIGTTPEWIMERVGIESRRTVLPLEYISRTQNADPLEAAAVSQYSNAQTGARASLMAIEKAGIKKEDIGMVIAGGCSAQYLIPAEACLIAAELGLEVPSFDLNSACSSFAVQLHFLRSMKEESLPNYVLVVNSENSTRSVDYRDRNTAVLWGDGTSAAVVSAKIPSKIRVTASTTASSPSGWAKVKTAVGKHFTQSGAEVQAFAIRKTLATLDILRELSPRKLINSYFIGHQANFRMLNKVCEKASIPADRHLSNVMNFGNCGAAGASSVLSQNWERFKSGDEIAVALVGSGLTWGGFLLEVD